MYNKISGGIDYSLSLIRLIALHMIIICHILQYLNNTLAWWLNVGVQIFLCLSGYLYGQKNAGRITSFYNKRFRKILIPYYIVLLLASFAEVLFARDRFDLLKFWEAIFCKKVIVGGEHLWFIPVILFCYILTPVLEAYTKEYIHSQRTIIIGLLLSCITTTIICRFFINFNNPAWINNYIIGYALGVNKKRQYISNQLIHIIIGISVIIGNAIQIYFDYVIVCSFSGWYEKAYQIFKNYNHVWLGIFLFLLLKTIFDRIRFQNKPLFSVFLNITDKYSYETYLVHQFLIVGPFSLMRVTKTLAFNIILILTGIYALAFILKKIEVPIIRQIARIGGE